jgi:AcrR family transcriptional regulator
MVEPAAEPRPAGRPRSADVEAQALRAAFEIYAERGWAGFSFGEVARRAGVGKAALYLRWPTKAELVLASLEAQQVSIGEIDTGSVRGDLLELARHLYRFVSGESGTASMRLQVESRVFPDLHAGLEGRAYRQPIRNARRIVRRAVEREELPAGVSPTVITDLIAGAVLNHVLATPPRLQAETQARSEEYFGQVVDVVLLGSIAMATRVPPQDNQAKAEGSNRSDPNEGRSNGNGRRRRNG